MKLNRLGFRKVDVDPIDVLHKREMKDILGGYLYCYFSMDGIGMSGYCGSSSSSVGCCNDLIDAYGSGYHNFNCSCS